MRDSSRQIKAGVLISYGNFFISTLIPLFYTPYMIRMLGMEEYGIYSLAKSVSGYLFLLTLGLRGGALKFINQAVAENDVASRDNLFTLFFYCYIVFFLAILVVGSILSVWAGSIFAAIPVELHPKLRILIGLVTLTTALTVLFSVHSVVITAYQRFIFAKTTGLVLAFITPALSVLCLWLGYRSEALLGASLFTCVLGSTVTIIYAHRVLKVHFIKGKVDFSPLKPIFHHSKYLFLASIAGTLYAVTDKFILGMFASASAVAVYSVGVTFHVYLQAMIVQISSLIFPKMNAMMAQGADILQLDALILKVGRLQYILLGLILSGFIVLGDRFISLWVGEVYESAYWIALLVMVPATVPLLQNSATSAMRAINKHAFRAWMFCFIAILNVLGSVWAVQYWGGIGCAAVTCISLLLGPLIIMNTYYQRVIGLDVFSFWKNILKMSGAFVTMVCLGLASKPYVALDSWGRFLAVSACFSVLYFVILWFSGMNRYEKDLMRGLVLKAIPHGRA